MDDEPLRKQRERIIELGRWAHELWKTQPLEDVIKAVEQRRVEADSDDRYTLALELIHFLHMAGRDREAIQIIDEMMTLLPDDVRFAITKASFYLYLSNDAEKARDAIDVALDRAYRTGVFRREALGVKARILLKLGLGDELSQTLEEIMSLQMKNDIPDSMRERDFVDRAPAGMIAKDVLARYNKFCPKKDGKQVRD